MCTTTEEKNLDSAKALHFAQQAHDAAELALSSARAKGEKPSSDQSASLLQALAKLGLSGIRIERGLAFSLQPLLRPKTSHGQPPSTQAKALAQTIQAFPLGIITLEWHHTDGPPSTYQARVSALKQKLLSQGIHKTRLHTTTISQAHESAPYLVFTAY